MSKKAEPKLNVRLLRRIQKHISEEPKRFFMEDVVLKATTPSEWKRRACWYHDAPKAMPPCGTAACIGGWANLLTGARRENEYLSYKRAVKHLGLIPGSPLANGWFDQSTLFFYRAWPYPFAECYQMAATSKQRAKIACARIEHLIKTGE